MQSEQGGRQAGPVPPDFSSLAPLTVSITGEARQLTIKELTSMSVPCFEELWTVGALLLYRLPCHKQRPYSLQHSVLLLHALLRYALMCIGMCRCMKC